MHSPASCSSSICARHRLLRSATLTNKAYLPLPRHGRVGEPRPSAGGLLCNLAGACGCNPAGWMGAHQPRPCCCAAAAATIALDTSEVAQNSTSHNTEAWLGGARGVARLGRYWQLLQVPGGLLAACTAFTACASLTTLAVAAVFGKGGDEQAYSSPGVLVRLAALPCQGPRVSAGA
jgi:hypothetical protein